MEVAVVIPCHNYGRYLGECLSSVLGQTRAPAEVVVVDDSSDDDTAAVAARFVDRGVRYLRIDARHVHQARRAGFGVTTAEALCFLDADDRMPADYLERAVPILTGDVAIAYPDLHEFGDGDALVSFGEFDRDRLDRCNFIPAPALVTRSALLRADAWRPIGTDQSHADWRLWQRVIDAGYSARRSGLAIHYRKHGASMIDAARGVNYWDRANLGDETVTVFTPLAGERHRGTWERYTDWLDRQTWPRSQVRLVLADTSQDAVFHRQVARWAAQSGYRIRLYAQPVGTPGLADLPRLEAEAAVNDAMCRIYRRMSAELQTRYQFIVEDDVVPPLDAVEQLFRSFDEHTAAVSGLYPGRFSDSVMAWDESGRLYSGANYPRGVTAIGGTGFGCLLIRRGALRGERFAAADRHYDVGFAARVRAKGLLWKLDAGCRAEHLGQFVPASPPAALAIANTCPHRSRPNWHARCRAGKGGIDPHFVVSADDCAACPHRGVA